MTSLGGLKLADGWKLGWELSKAENGESGRAMEAAVEFRICMAWLRVARRLQRS